MVVRTESQIVLAYPSTELVAPIRTARGVGNLVSLLAGTSSVARLGRGWALEREHVHPYIHGLSWPERVGAGSSWKRGWKP